MPFSELECVKIVAAREELESRIEKYLSTSGWVHSSATADFCWRWFKTINGVRYGCGTEDAFKIQNTVARATYARNHPDEFED